MINRDVYLKKLIESKHINLIKVITGIRRCGKSYLLDPIFTNHLKQCGVDDKHIIKVDLDDVSNEKYRDFHALNEYILARINDDQMHYIILDEIQLVPNFEFLLNGFLRKSNVDVYVTGSNSKFLSSDIITEFRGRSLEIRVFPLSFKEFYEAKKIDKQEAYKEYLRYGGMPLLISLEDEEQKSQYLKSLVELTYLRDIVERNNVAKNEVLESLIKMLASSVGSLVSARKILNSYISNGNKQISLNTILSYLAYIQDAFLIENVERYDVKGRKYIKSLSKYYFADVGLRNAVINFRQQEENHIMENIIYLELLRKGYSVDIGIVEIRSENTRKQLEVDFVCNQFSKRYYIQSALHLDTTDKLDQEVRPYLNISDSFKKIIIVKDDIKPWDTDDGVLVIGIIDFLLNENSLKL